MNTQITKITPAERKPREQHGMHASSEWRAWPCMLRCNSAIDAMRALIKSQLKQVAIESYGAAEQQRVVVTDMRAALGVLAEMFGVTLEAFDGDAELIKIKDSAVH
jgi:hypothetical protein